MIPACRVDRAGPTFARRSAARAAGPTRRIPTADVTARTVSQVAVEVTKEYRPNDARFWPRGAPGRYEMPVPEPTAKGQNQRFMISPKAYAARMP